MSNEDKMIIFLVSDLNAKDAGIMHDVGCSDALISYWHLMSSKKSDRLRTFMQIIEEGLPEEVESENS